MSTGYSWEGIRQVRVTLLGARHVPERLCGGRVYLRCYIKCSTFAFFKAWYMGKGTDFAYSTVPGACTGLVTARFTSCICIL